MNKFLKIIFIVCIILMLLVLLFNYIYASKIIVNNIKYVIIQTDDFSVEIDENICSKIFPYVQYKYLDINTHYWGKCVNGTLKLKNGDTKKITISTENGFFL